MILHVIPYESYLLISLSPSLAQECLKGREYILVIISSSEASTMLDIVEMEEILNEFCKMAD